LAVTTTNSELPATGREQPFFNGKKYGAGFAGALSALSAGGVAILESVGDLNNVLVAGLLGLSAVGLLAIAIVAASDVVSQAYLTVNAPRTVLQAKVTTHASMTHMLAPGSLRIQLDGFAPALLDVIALGLDSTSGTTSYLVAQPDGPPAWVSESKVKRAVLRE
jgi:hypothetical protein